MTHSHKSEERARARARKEHEHESERERANEGKREGGEERGRASERQTKRERERERERGRERVRERERAKERGKAHACNRECAREKEKERETDKNGQSERERRRERARECARAHLTYLTNTLVHNSDQRDSSAAHVCVCRVQACTRVHKSVSKREDGIQKDLNKALIDMFTQPLCLTVGHVNCRATFRRKEGQCHMSQIILMYVKYVLISKNLLEYTRALAVNLKVDNPASQS